MNEISNVTLVNTHTISRVLDWLEWAWRIRFLSNWKLSDALSVRNALDVRVSGPVLDIGLAHDPITRIRHGESMISIVERCSRTVVWYGIPGCRIRGEGPWACDGGIGVGRGPRRGWRALPSPTLQRKVSSALRLLLLLHSLLSTGSPVRTVLKTLARGHYVTHSDHRMMRYRCGVMRRVRTRGGSHVRCRTRQRRTRTTPATLVATAAAAAAAAATAAARLSVLHQYRNCHASRWTRALQHKQCTNFNIPVSKNFKYYIEFLEKSLVKIGIIL